MDFIEEHSDPKYDFWQMDSCVKYQKCLISFDTSIFRNFDGNVQKSSQYMDQNFLLYLNYLIDWVFETVN